MKVVINKCFGGFSLSPKAIKRLAELQGRKCYFFKRSGFSETDKYGEPLKHAPADSMLFQAFDIPNPDKVLAAKKKWHEMTMLEKEASNKLYESHELTSRPEDRADPLLVQVVQELGEKANGACAALKIVEIPDGVEWEIAEYDGNEHIAPKSTRRGGEREC